MSFLERATGANPLRVGLLIFALHFGVAGNALATGSEAVKAATFELFFTADAPDGIPSNNAAKQFACTDKIFLVVDVNGLAEAADYELAVTWTDPHGKEREQTRYEFAAFGQQTRLWAWLQMHRGSGGTLMSIVDGAAGMKAFIGEWMVSVFVDGINVGRNGFNVIC